MKSKVDIKVMQLIEIDNYPVESFTHNLSLLILIL